MARPKHERTLRLCLAAFYMDYSAGVFIVALPYLALSMGAESLDLGILGAARSGAYIAAAIPAALLADRYSRRVLLAFSSAGVVIMLATTAAAATVWHLAVISALWSASLALYWPAVFAWLGDSHSTDRLAPASGAVNLSWSVGAMVGGLAAGWLFEMGSWLPFPVAALPVGLGCLAVLFAPRGEGHPLRAALAEPAPGTRRELMSAWTGSFSACCMVGVVMFVFPALGAQIGVDARLFGVFMGGFFGLGRTAVFLAGLRWGRRLQDWRLAVPVQLISALFLATFFVARSPWWIGVVFLVVGVNMGVNYYRGLYKSLEEAGARGLKSGIHESVLLTGLLIGSFGGGAVAQVFGLRAPYAILLAVAVLLAVVQVALVVSARRARGAAPRRSPA